ncbi:MAG TPA: hypothetical protein VE992_04200 [Solirubrobacteraceae bacterium]|nr:hypothetical protein [Solirubrobacteraceae bacterium]
MTPRDASRSGPKQPQEILTALPRSRPHRRSAKRAVGPGEGGAEQSVGPGEGGAKQSAKAAAPSPAAKPSAPSPAKAPARRQPSARAKTSTRGEPSARGRPPAGAQPPAAPEPPAQAQSLRRPRTAVRAGAREAPLQQPPQPRGLPPKPTRGRPPAERRPLPPKPPRRATTPERRPDVVATAVQAAAELAEIGLSASARALRGVVSRLPRP